MTRQIKATKKRVSLVLGSGGARGLAHIGVIESLAKREFELCYIAGTSMGALIGGVHAAGKLDTYTDWVTQLTKRDVVGLLDFSFTMSSLFKGERIMTVLKDLIGECDIEDLPIGFTAVATDIKEQREVWLNRGPLFDAIRASIAVPTVFAPVELNGRLLVDGGIVNPIPIAPTLNDDTELTIAVDLNAPPDPRIAERDDDGDANEGDVDQTSSYRKAITSFIDGLIGNEDKKNALPSAVDLVTQSMDTMQNTIARLKLAAYTPDITVEIPRNLSTFFEFHRARDLIEAGRKKTEAALDEHLPA